jgi:hypothetical protein
MLALAGAAVRSPRPRRCPLTHHPFTDIPQPFTLVPGPDRACLHQSHGALADRAGLASTTSLWIPPRPRLPVRRRRRFAAPEIRLPALKAIRLRVASPDPPAARTRTKAQAAGSSSSRPRPALPAARPAAQSSLGGELARRAA